MAEFLAVYYDTSTDKLLLKRGKKANSFTLYELLKEADKPSKKGGLTREFWGSVWTTAKQSPDRWVLIE